MILMAFSSRSSQSTSDIVVYWGQNGFEGSLRDACSGAWPYTVVSIAFLITFGGGRRLALNLASHCHDYQHCEFLSDEIRHCQSQGIKVLLSLGGSGGNYGLTSPDDARDVARALWNTFLGGTNGSFHRPMGEAVLDGIDFDIESGSNLYYDDLARALSGYSTPERKVYLSLVRQCVYRDYYLDAAIKTGLFDYVWVQFYNNPAYCYDGNEVTRVLDSRRNTWTPAPPTGSKLLLGLPAAPEAAPTGGYVPANVVVDHILPVIRATEKYGGVMLWSRYYDNLHNYSNAIAFAVYSDDHRTC